MYLSRCDTRKRGKVFCINSSGKCLERWQKQISMLEFYMFSYEWIFNDSIYRLNFYILLVMVMVFVKFTQEGSGGESDSLEENFTLK